ncbi:MAG: glycosyltransferase family 2 protein [Verrucomicrobiota bacterium]|nr:glycosyltransferase family 2 protein [Limisphaera sp.]MDW8380579.1 glycosyltransferase family 2 protein [Verrucomicrobiota bacterium]
MLRGRKIVVVMPAYNAAKTLPRTWAEVRAQEIVDEIILVDDASRDETVAIARSLQGIHVHVHPRNRGYGANQKTCYRLALEAGADIVIMIHPDYQYTPALIPAMASLIANGIYDCVLGSRILGGQALRGGMPVWKYLANRGLTLVENWLLGAKLSEYHTGYRAFDAAVLRRIDFTINSDDFVFDNQMLAQVLWHGFRVGEVSCPTHYFPEASSINFARSVRYGWGCLLTALVYRLARWRLIRSRLFPPVLSSQGCEPVAGDSSGGGRHGTRSGAIGAGI